MSGPAFAPLVNMTPELNALMPPAGACWICGGPDKRHRLIDAIRERHRAGDPVEMLRYEYDDDGRMIEAVLALRPVRWQRSRAKGARMPWGAKYVGRPSRWGNPWKVGAAYPESLYPLPLTARQAACSYTGWLYGMRPQNLADLLAPLRDATALCCWCPASMPCHVDVLLELIT